MLRRRREGHRRTGVRRGPTRPGKAQGAGLSETQRRQEKSQQRTHGTVEALEPSFDWPQGREAASVWRGLTTYFWIFCFPACCAGSMGFRPRELAWAVCSRCA
eukprot:XP_001705556.1 Hypothetical protein GL50803_106057 [Giardia lamblia ATCC 50803]